VRFANPIAEVLKKPLHTSIAVEMDEFDEIEVQDKLHIIISVKDFRAVLQHAQMTSGKLSALYSIPGKPMKLSYNADGILCDFILMTVGDKDPSAQKGKKGRTVVPKTARPGLEQASNRESSVANPATAERPSQPAAPPPSKPVSSARQKVLFGSRPRPSQFEMRPEPLPPPSLRPESLFVTQDDDRFWEPANPDEDEDEDEGDNARLEWNASDHPVSILESTVLPPVTCN